LGSGEAYLPSQLIRVVVLPKGLGAGRLGNGFRLRHGKALKIAFGKLNPGVLG
jgi:hypothetical protein